MKKLVLALVLTSTTLSVFARDRHQSYFTHEDGGTVVRQSGGGEIEGRVNLPVFPGDEVRTARRGRAEIRLADGNIIALDRNTILRFGSILDSYDGESSQTVAELSYGNVFVHDGDEDDAPLRLDTRNASYVSTRDAIYEVETSGADRDVLSVFVGTVEVRTQAETSRVRAGEEVRIDEDGIYGSNTLARDGTTDFERWYLRRAERYGREGSRYLDARLGYADNTLNSYGSWIYVNDYGRHVWRPYVSVGWRPYHYGSWVHGPSGYLNWVSDEPWGWVPYHYGRWAFTSMYGWVWLPGQLYAPAWVYWAFGPSYVGWVPSGYYDCYRPYNRWLWSGNAYHGYDRFDVGFGFHGRVRLSGIDLTPWTFVDSKGLLSRRTDRAAMSIDAVRSRLTQDGDRALVSGTALTLGRNGMKDPASAIGVIARRGLGGGTGTESSGSATDMTPFFRRDPELSTSIRDRVLRSAGSSGSGNRTGGLGTPGSSGGTGATGGISRDGSSGTAGRSGGISRGLTPNRPNPAGTPRTGIDRSGSGTRPDPAAGSPAPTPAPSNWRAPSVGRPGRDAGPDREAEQGDTRARGISRPGTQTAPGTPAPAVPDSANQDRADGWRQSSVQRPRQDDGRPQIVPRRNPESGEGSSWRNGSNGTTGSSDSRPRSGGRIQRDSSGSRSSDVPRRVIEGIGGARVSPAPASGRSSPRDSSGSRPTVSSGRSSPTPRVERARERSSPPPAAPRQESSPRKEGNIKPE